MASRFLSETTGAVYLSEYAKYLADRGCDMADFPAVMYADKNMGLNTEDGATFMVEGWAFMVRGPDGLPDPNKLHMRACNYPTGKIYMGAKKETRKLATAADLPKFIQLFKDEFLHYTVPRAVICHAPVVMVHEKITSAMLATKYLGFPGVALSGCAGWSKGGKINKEFEFLIKNLELHAKILVCFDGDVAYKHGIQEAARGLKGWVNTLRPDLEIVFLQVPENDVGVGWDDWVVSKGEIAAAEWPMEVMRQGTGIEITSFVPASFLIEEYQLTVSEGKDGKLSPQHTLDNYVRLLRYPRFAALAVDVSGLIYNTDNIDAGPVDFDGAVLEYRKWLETNVFRGSSAGSVRVTFAKDALTEVLANKEVSVPHMLLERQPEVTKDEATAAARLLVTEGIKVTGPMPEDHTVETVIRMSRDMVALWGTDEHVDVQWACALVGPSGCGKSNFPKSFVACFSDWGYRPRIAQLAKEGSKAELSELYKACRDSLVGVFDEYNPADHSAKQVEQNIFTLSTTRVTDARELFKERASKCVRHASIFLTTVDTNRNYIRSSKGAGERRFITLEVVGTQYWDGALSSNRTIIKQCGATLLRYGFQLYKAEDAASATEHSRATAADYIGESGAVGKISQFWVGHTDAEMIFRTFGAAWDHKGIIHCTWPVIYNLLMPGNADKFGRQDKADIQQFVLDLGATVAKKGRVKGKVMDNRVTIENWTQFKENLFTKVGIL